MVILWIVIGVVWATVILSATVYYEQWTEKDFIAAAFIMHVLLWPITLTLTACAFIEELGKEIKKKKIK